MNLMSNGVESQVLRHLAHLFCGYPCHSRDLLDPDNTLLYFCIALRGNTTLETLTIYCLLLTHSHHHDALLVAF